MSRTVPPIERVEPSILEPARLADLRDRVRRTVPEVVDALDRRGFRLLHWPPIRPNAAGKPFELSLEHEARLRPTTARSLPALRRALDRAEGRALFEGDPLLGALVLRRVRRATSAQSVDHYWDVEGRLSGGLTRRTASLRRRIRTSKFMTWAAGDDADAVGVFNLELPLVALGTSGVVARLEFNWIDRLDEAVAEFDAIAAGEEGDARNPLRIAVEALPPGLGGPLRPALEHTTYREKYSLRTRSPDTGIEEERFQLNVDHMIVQSLSSGHIAHHADVDVAAATPVDAEVLGRLDGLAAGLSRRFGLAPADAPKVWWGAVALDELG